MIIYGVLNVLITIRWLNDISTKNQGVRVDMEDNQIIGIIMIFVIIAVFRCISGSWRCYLAIHDTFVNTPFDEIGNHGESTLRCNRCFKDVKNLGYLD